MKLSINLTKGEFKILADIAYDYGLDLQGFIKNLLANRIIARKKMIEEFNDLVIAAFEKQEEIK